MTTCPAVVERRGSVRARAQAWQAFCEQMRTMPLPVSLAELFHLVRTEVKGADLTSWHSLLANSDVGITGLRRASRRINCAYLAEGYAALVHMGRDRALGIKASIALMSTIRVMPLRRKLILGRNAHGSRTCHPRAAASGRGRTLPARWWPEPPRSADLPPRPTVGPD